MESGYFQLPIWIMVLFASICIGLIGYIWHRMDKRVDASAIAISGFKTSLKETSDTVEFNTGRINKIQQEEEESVKHEIEKGGYLMSKDHGEMCQTVCSNISKMLTEKFNSFEENINLKLENLKLAMINQDQRAERRARKRSVKKS